MHRCAICDSTQFKDTLAEDGLEQRLSYFVTVDGEERCNRCNDAIADTLQQFAYDDEESGPFITPLMEDLDDTQ